MALPLVVGVDGSEPSLTAVDWAVDEAARNGLPLRLVYASWWERYEGPVPTGGAERPAEQTLAEHIVGSAAERAHKRNPELEVSTGILPEDTVSALLREGNNASVLVTGSRGRGEPSGLLLGSTSLAVAARAHGPVVVVRGDGAGPAGTHGRILLGAGESDTGAEAVRFAFREAETRGCVLDVVRAWRSPAQTPGGYEERAAALLEELLREAVSEHPAVQVRGATVEGPAHRVLVDRSAAADLVVVGTRRRVGHLGLQLGRTDHALLHRARCPVAIVPARV
ncbi:universal stress protein [Streptomyces kebangsaanensis]|uniref:universal stress protein n=1 Tax=Streptomyces kebangsaanensis TaxID=864058 RepID=UPI00093D9743|nr:universal stress protein [Streptomyces kebangsaanensis]